VYKMFHVPLTFVSPCQRAVWFVGSLPSGLHILETCSGATGTSESPLFRSGSAVQYPAGWRNTENVRAYQERRIR